MTPRAARDHGRGRAAEVSCDRHVAAVPGPRTESYRRVRGTSRDARPAERIWRTASRYARATAIGLAVALALVGALLAPPAQMLIWAPAVGLLAIGFALLTVPAMTGEPIGRRTVVMTGLVAFLLVPFTSGLAVIGPAGGVLLVATLMLGAVWLVERVVDAPERSTAEAARRDAARVKRVVGDLTVESLVTEWRAAGDRLRSTSDPEVRAVTAEIRSLLFEELTRRDPAGVEHWLGSGGGDPGGHVSGGPNRTG